jgi:uncharacterized DUF497 family protein
MKHMDWDINKNVLLRRERFVCFEDVMTAIDEGHLLADKEHPNQATYPHQRIFIVEIDMYAYVVPYVDNGERIFLNTIIPSRKATKEYVK